MQNLVAPHRVFIREGAMDMRNSESKKNKDKKSVYVYAFNDLVRSNWLLKRVYLPYPFYLAACLQTKRYI